MKKFFALVLALVMALSLVACGDKKDDSGDVTAEHTDTTTVAVGAVILLSREEGARMGETEITVAETAAGFIGRQMEQ